MHKMFETDTLQFGPATFSRQLVPGGFKFFIDGQPIHTTPNVIDRMWTLLTAAQARTQSAT